MISYPSPVGRTLYKKREFGATTSLVWRTCPVAFQYSIHETLSCHPCDHYSLLSQSWTEKAPEKASRPFLNTGWRTTPPSYLTQQSTCSVQCQKEVHVLRAVEVMSWPLGHLLSMTTSRNAHTYVHMHTHMFMPVHMHTHTLSSKATVQQLGFNGD